MERKENVKCLFFNNSTKQWHFDEIVKQSKLGRAQANAWIKLLSKEEMIKRIKPKDKMPYYVANWENSSFKAQKRVYALERLEKSGFLAHLISLEKAKTVVIFGSMARWDWYDKSDIDLFIYGNDDDLEQGKYEIKLNREIQVFSAKDKEELKKLPAGLLKSIATGYFVKGGLDFAEVKLNA
ncbi:MAG: nucleotidyltransferase domain-containing protein [Nanoarchaeota archaeon]|nr:nucleotidyltransferase domain-containing protein [Nanoarchaeota archaeon]